MPKRPVERVRVEVSGVAGDFQKNRKYHGGPDRAICLYSAELYDWLRTQNIDLAPGSVGENFTTAGIDLQSLVAGQRLHVGDCQIELSEVREPCRNLNRVHAGLLQAMQGRSGWMARVTQDGWVHAGADIQIQDESP